MDAQEYYNMLFESDMATATEETSVASGTANKFIFYNGSREQVKKQGSTWIPVNGNPILGVDYNPKYLKIEDGNGWELGNTVMKISGNINDSSDALLNVLHSGMPISTPMSESIINDVIAKIENSRAKRGSSSDAIRWTVDEGGKNLTMYATDAGSLRSLKKGLSEYKKKHALSLNLANINSLAKNLQSVQQRINKVCNSTPSMSVEFAHSLGDSISVCKKANDFVSGLRSSTTPSSAMGSLMRNNKILSNMADEKSSKDSFPNMLKRLTIIRKKMLEHFTSDEINEKNQSKYRDILTALIDKDNPSDPDLAEAERQFGQKLSSIGITPEVASNKLYDELDSKYKNFNKTVFQTEEEAEATAQALLLQAGKYYNLGLIDETWYKSYVNTINAILAHKIETLRRAREFEQMTEPGSAPMPGDVESTLPEESEGEKDIPSYSYYFLYDMKFQLPLNEPIKISLKTEKKIGAWHSILSRLGKAGWELLGYVPQPYINSIIDSYATTRDCRVMLPSAILKGSAVVLNALGRKAFGRDTWISPNNEKRFQISKWLREEMQTKAGEINPEVKKIESGLVNIPRSLGNGWRQITGKERLAKPVAHIDTTNFDGSNIAPDRIKYAESGFDKNQGKSGHYKMSEDEKTKGKLTRECAEGGAAMDGAVSTGDGFYQMPGSISSEGNPIAATYTQSPFVNGVKTSVSDSGSGDKFANSINKKKKKNDTKGKNNEWFNRIQALPDVQSFFDGWGE